MDRESMHRLVVDAYAARDSGNAMEVVAAFHDDGVFELAGNKASLALAGAIEGHPNLEQAMKDFIETFDFSGRKIISFVAEGDCAAVHSRLTVKHKDASFTTELLDLFTFKDGKVSKLIEFADTALIKHMTASA